MNEKTHKKSLIKAFGRRGGVFLLALTLCLPMGGQLTWGAAPRPSTDETVYVNLDYYGEIQELNIVKGVSLNGQDHLEDFGNYAQVVNMTSEAKPKIQGDRLDFSGLDTGKKFFYQVTPKENPQLPWEFDISYRLNGVPIEAEKLGGAAGFVEIHIQAHPVDTGMDYVNNNMILTVTTLVDMRKNLSVDAPGAQMQTLGDETVVLFMLLPGEEGDFTIGIGSESFESTGILFGMVPGTLQDLEKIPDFKENKEDMKNAMDSLYDSARQMTQVLDSMEGGLQEVREGLSSLQRARAKVHAYGGTLDLQTGEEAENLRDLAQKTADGVPHLNTAKAALEDLNQNLKAGKKQVEELSPRLDTLARSMGDVENNLDNIAWYLNRGDSTGARKEMERLAKQVKDFQEKLQSLQGLLQSLEKATDSNASLGGEDIQSLERALQEAGMLGLGEETGGLENLKALQEGRTREEQMKRALNQVIEECSRYLERLSRLLNTYGVEGLKELEGGLAEGRDLVHNSADMLDDTQGVLLAGKELGDQTRALMHTMDSYHESSLAALDSSAALLNSVERNLSLSADILTTLHGLLESSRGDMNAGMQKTLEAGMELTDRGLEGLKINDSLRSAQDTLKDIWDRKTEELENDSNVLNMDPGAAKVSFTSDKNPAPNSLQVVLRSQEIRAPKKNDVIDPEQGRAAATPLDRIGRVFHRIFHLVKSLFS